MVDSSITAVHDHLILDACCVMNLYASRRMGEILTAIRETAVVARYVMEVEALTVYQTAKGESPHKREIINLQPLIDDGLLLTADLQSDAEKNSFAHFIMQRLDEGEAATMAIATHRNWAVATDDRAARRLCQRRCPENQLISTPELMKHWAETAQPEPTILSNALRDVENRANYLVGQRRPLYEWWEASK